MFMVRLHLTITQIKNLENVDFFRFLFKIETDFAACQVVIVVDAVYDFAKHRGAAETAGPRRVGAVCRLDLQL
jgi:hypothetical protein